VKLRKTCLKFWNRLHVITLKRKDLAKSCQRVTCAEMWRLSYAVDTVHEKWQLCKLYANVLLVWYLHEQNEVAQTLHCCMNHVCELIVWSTYNIKCTCDVFAWTHCYTMVIYTWKCTYALMCTSMYISDVQIKLNITCVPAWNCSHVQLYAKIVVQIPFQCRLPGGEPGWHAYITSLGLEHDLLFWAYFGKSCCIL